jgi:hypothetical protein
MEVKLIQATSIKTSDEPITDIPEGYHVKRIKKKYYLIKTTEIEVQSIVDKGKTIWQQVKKLSTK